ncbi:MFS transporter [Streptomyces coeruleoprunus]|uniref:MFS transporter n=1 Tax=Streptomyces coeruleoprunus TaxID=285563 RepID=A0ABV9XEY3_9ACTN
MTHSTDHRSGTVTEATAAPAAAERTPVRYWLATVSISLAVFAFTTTEMVPIGLLTAIGPDLDVSTGTTGLAVTLFGGIAGLAAPFMTSFTRTVDRRALMLVLALVLIAGNELTALAPNFAVLMAARVVLGFAHGLMWSIAASIALRLVAPKDAVRATSVVFGGISVASVVGVPLGTFIGELTDWRTVFHAIAGLGAVFLVAAAVLLPKLPSRNAARVADLPRLLRDRNILTAVVITVLVVAGHFAAYTYLAPYLEDRAGIDPKLISTMLLVYGVAGVAGNFVGGAAAARNLRGTLLVAIAVLAVTLVALLAVGTFRPGVYLLLVLWGLSFTAIPVCVQTVVFTYAGDSPEAATSLFVLGFNVSVGLGSLIGGLIVDHASLTAVFVTGAALAVLALLNVLRLKKEATTP